MKASTSFTYMEMLVSCAECHGFGWTVKNEIQNHRNMTEWEKSFWIEQLRRWSVKDIQLI